MQNVRQTTAGWCPNLSYVFFFLDGLFTYLMWPVTFFMGVADTFIRLWI